jgi:hypothetical protein
MSTDRIRQRFSEEQIRHLVERSLFKMSQCPDQVAEWVSHYRTVYGEVTVVYAKEPRAAVVAYDDEMPPSVLAKAGGDGTHGSGYPAGRAPAACIHGVLNATGTKTLCCSLDCASSIVL